MADLQKGTTFIDGVSTANAANLNNLVDLGSILPDAIAGKVNLASPSTGCEILVNDAGVLKKVTIANLASAITGGTGAQVHGKTAITALTDLDEFLVWEDTAAAERKITYANLIGALEDDLDVATSGPDIFTGTLTHDPSSIPADDTREVNITVTGASTANTPAVAVSPSIDLTDLGVQIVEARVTGANTVKVTYYNFWSTSVNLPNHTLRAVVFQF